MQVQTETKIACSQLVPGKYQPREYFDPKAHEELTASIKAQGVLQSLLIRPIGDGYEIVAGERRWRAAIAAHSDAYEVPVIIRQMTDEEARAAALTENIQRENMSPTEEAVAATKVLGDYAGNRTEAAKHLGWSMTKFESRLALMNCSESVRSALNERKILLGHAELLAAITKEKQDIVLKRMFDAPTLPSVTEMKGFLNELSQVLATAIFDKADCAACQHNSSCQSALFSEAIDAGKCTHSECYKKKTEEELEKRAEAIRENYPVVRIVRPGENNTLLKLKAEGETGVGEEQAKACRGCANFGAAISAVPDKLGTEYRDLCFDPACNAKKVAEFRKAQAEANKAAQKAKPATAKGAAPAKAGEKATSEAPATVTTTATPPKVQDSTRLKEYRVKVWRNLLKKLLLSDPAKNLVALLALTMSGNGSKIGSHDLANAYEKQTGHRPDQFDIAAMAAHIDSADAVVKQNTHLGITATMVNSIEERTLTQLLNWIKADLAAEWKLNKEYLELLTKSEIDLVAEEIGLKAYLGDKFGKAMGAKKDELLKALLNAEGFDYARKVPKHLLWS